MGRDFKGVFERKPGSGVWSIEWTDDSGQRRRRVIGAKKDAIEAVEQMRARARLTKVAPELAFNEEKVRTLDEVMEHCNETRELKKRTKRLYEGYRREWNRKFPHATLCSITTEMLEKWRSKRLQEQTFRGDPISKTTVNRELGYLKMIYKTALERRWCQIDPTVLLKKFRENNKKDDFFEPAQMESILALQHNLFGPIYSMITEIAVQTGMRKSEQFNLLRRDLNLSLGVIRLMDSKSGKKEWVELNERAIELFTKLFSLHDDRQWVFPSTAPRHAGRSMNGDYFSEKFFIPIVQELGLEGTWHKLRHTYGSWLRLAGVDLCDIRDLMRHSDATVTERYAHIGRTDRKKAVNRLSSVFSRQPEGPPTLRLVQGGG